MQNRDAMPSRPPAGGDEFEVILLGPPTYFTPPPEVKARGQLVPAGDGEGLPHRPAPDTTRRVRPNVPLIPSADEIQRLPRQARIAFSARCALRVLPVTHTGASDLTVDVAEQVSRAVRAILESATTDTPLTAQLRCIRRDFDRLKRLAREQNWTDDTPVPPDVFGPLWPPGVEPHWAVEPLPGARPAE